MKRISCLLILLFGMFLPAAAGPVDAARAASVARSFFQNDRNVALRFAPLQRVEQAAAPLTKAGADHPAYYIFNREGGGFVIVAGDDACKPVLAYSYDHPFVTDDTMPDGLSDWLSDFEEQVSLVRAEGVRPADADRVWASALVATKAENGYKPAIQWKTPVWSQGAPFNSLTPIQGDKHCVTGCVPLAMGMLMRFFTYPAKGEGTLASYSYDLDNETYSIDGYDLGYPYDWEHIRYDYTGEYTEEEGAAVARLVYDCGVAVQAKFAETTSASTPLMAGRAAEYFGFDPAAYYYKRDFVGDEAWLELLKGDLQDHPVLYSARRDGGGHSFLVDGYDEQGLVSVNWGWGGNNNGFYALSAFTPRDNRQYLYRHGAVFGLVPRQGSGKASRGYLYFQAGTSSSGTEYKGLTPSEDIRPGKPFTMRAGFLYNGGIYPFEGQYFLALTDENGVVKEQICDVKDIDPIIPGNGRGYTSIDCTMQSYPMEGERIRLLYRSSDWPADVWEFPVYSPDITAEILVSDASTLSGVTSIRYDKSRHEMVIQTKDRVEWSLTSSSGTAVTTGIRYSGGQLTIDTASLKGSYKLSLQRGKDQYSLTLIF